MTPNPSVFKAILANSTSMPIKNLKTSMPIILLLTAIIEIRANLKRWSQKNQISYIKSKSKDFMILPSANFLLIFKMPLLKVLKWFIDKFYLRSNELLRTQGLFFSKANLHKYENLYIVTQIAIQVLEIRQQHKCKNSLSIRMSIVF